MRRSRAAISTPSRAGLLVDAVAGGASVNFLAGLLVSEEALRHDQVQMILGAGHGDIEQAPLFFELGRAAGTEVRGDAAVDPR